MAIWRGAGGPGDATTDAANEASVASTKAAEADASATAAAGSATSAAASATSASSSATAAASSASSASSSASSASSSASSASTSATNASSFASTASLAKDYAEEWATKAEDSLISTDAGGDGSTDYSSLHHAAKASASASAASSSASSASSSASAAATAQTNAETAETNAETAQTAAEAARDAALAALDNFDDRYLGEKSSDPTLDNDGDALVAGALYFDTTLNLMKVYTGSAWVAAYVSIGSLTTDDLPEGSTNLYYTDARVGSYLTTNSYATQSYVNTATANSSNWDTAYSWGNHASAGYLTSYTETDPVYTASSWYSTTNNSSNWNTAYGWGDHASAGYLVASNNLSDLGSAATARTNLDVDQAGTAVALAIALG